MNRKRINDASSLEKSKTFCVMPWVHFHITQYGTVTPCCQAPWQEAEAFGNINTETIAEIWRNEKINSFRKSMLEGKADKRCESCFIKEKRGFTSLRQITNHRYKHKSNLVLSTGKNGEIDSSMPVYFDIRFSNVCNLKCRICGPWSSSSWHSDAVKLGMVSDQSKPVTYSVKNTEHFFEQFKEVIPFLEELYFAGGEPLVTDEHYTILKLLIDSNRTDVKLTYNTNFSSLTYLDFNVIELWKQFKNISIAASLDGSEKRGEFLRKNLKWKYVIENRKIIMEQLPHIEFLISPTTNIYNLLHLPDFHLDWVNKGLISVEDFIPTLLIKPKELSISILPLSYRNKAIVKYKAHLEWVNSMPFRNSEKRDYMIRQFNNVITSLSISTPEKQISLFNETALAMDKLRNENTLEIFPELRELF